MSGRARVVVVTGLSGAGKSTVLRALEDLGFYCVDNLPTPLVARTVEVCEAGGVTAIGLGIDVRVGSFLDDAVPALRAVQRDERDVSVLFVDAADDTLLRRYSETRRPHPLATREGAEALDGGPLAVLDGLQLERDRLAPLRAQATVFLDTTWLSIHELRRRVLEHLGPGRAQTPRMITRFLSFGFKYGVPLDADLVFDVRFLDNPFFVPELRRLPGTDPAVRDYVLERPDTPELVRRLEDLLAYLVPRYEREGKSYLTVGLGCTGGRHRSVVLAALLGDRLREQVEGPVAVVHRDVARAEQPESIRDAGSGRPT